MSCSTVLTGIALDCGNVGGISEVYIAPIADVATVTVVDGAVSAITMVSTKKFVKYSFRRGTSQFTETGTRDDAAGTAFVTAEVEMKFAKKDADKRKEMQSLMNGNTYVIVKDNNDLYWFIGYGSYCSASAATGGSGTNRGDANEYTITLQSEQSEFSNTVTKTIVDGVI